MGRILLSILLLFFIGLSCSCGKPSKSNRDVKRDELRNTAENKRKELQPVVGRYQGSLDLPGNHAQGVSLNLVVRDVPTTVEGQVDPVMTPTLGGDFRFDYGNGKVLVEYVTFGIDKGDFEPKGSKISLAASSATYKDLVLQLTKTDDQLSGTWTIEKYGSGAIALHRAGEVPEGFVTEPLKATYRGKLTSNMSLPEDIEVNFVTSQDVSQPEGIKVSGNLRMYYDGFTGTEWQDYRFDTIEPNYFLRTINAKSNKDGLTLKLKIDGKKLSGTIEMNTLGQIGSLEVEKL